MSLPSRVRSPTPQKTDRPPCSRATLWISSWIRTVLPTPAPPKRPTLPPLTYGASRSITLIPVSSSSVVGESSWKLGGSRWIGQRSPSAGSLSPRSIVSPSTLKMRPSVCSPTGTEIGSPVSTTSSPRERPSVESIATARMRSSPRCCCTSAISVVALAPSWPGTSMLTALLISGRPPVKTASMTTPLISTILPAEVFESGSGMGLLERCFGDWARDARASEKRRQSIEASLGPIQVPSHLATPTQSKHPRPRPPPGFPG